MRRIALVSVVFCSAACASSYEPTAPHGLRAQRISVELRRVEPGPVSGARATPAPILFTVVADLQAPRNARLRHVRIADARHAPCSAGVESAGLWMDEKYVWERPAATRGARDLRVEFAGLEPGDVLESDSALDLDLETDTGRRCLRVPLGSAASPPRWRRRLPWSVDFRLRITAPLEPVAGIGTGYSLDFDVGRWIGPLRLRAGYGVGYASCEGECTDSDESYEIFEFVTFPANVAVDALLLEHGQFAFTAGAGYELMLALGGSKEGDTEARRHALVHGPRAAMSWLWVAPPRATGDGGMRRARGGLELALARWHAADAQPAFVLSAGLVWGLGL